jgi:hypothetical protein
MLARPGLARMEAAARRLVRREGVTPRGSGRRKGLGVLVVNRTSHAIVVEHDPKVRAVVTRLLQARGYAVHAVPSRNESFDLLDDLAPELLVLDDPARGPLRRVVRLAGDTAMELTEGRPKALEAALERLLR